MKTLNLTTLIITIAGGINWAIFALFDMDLITFLFGMDTMVTNFFFVLIGLSALCQIWPLILSFDLDEEVAEVTAGRMMARGAR